MRLLLACAAATYTLAANPVAGQQVRVSGTSSLRYIELRPLIRDSVAADEVDGSGLMRLLPDGRTVRCVPEDPFCRYTAPGPRVAAVPLMHDLEASAWGLGRGVRAWAQVRLRSAWGGGADLWPQADDAFDVLAAYAELQRERYHLRVGRQWQVSGLGFYNFDGINGGLSPADGLWAEGWVGRSLVRGMNESRAGGALASIEELAPPAEGVLAGMHLRYRPAPRLAVAAVYQADFRDDGSGMYAELAALNASWGAGAGSLDAALEVDVATASLNEARLRFSSVPIGPFVLHAETRRYRPYFELWTIWGAFSPVGFDEVRGGASWRAAARALVLRGEASYRSYGEAGIEHALDAFHGHGWGAAATGHWLPAPQWRVDAALRAEGGFGAARRDGHAGVTRQLGDLGGIAVQALAFERLYEFRLTEGTVYGLAGELSLRLTDRARVFASAAAYHHPGFVSAGSVDWNQRRGSVRFQWTAGAEPAAPLAGAGGGR